MSAMFLDAAELFGITKRRQHAAQARELDRLGVPHSRRIDGSVLVWRHAIGQPRAPQTSTPSGLNWSRQA